MATCINIVFEDRLTRAIIYKLLTLRKDLAVGREILTQGRGKIQKNLAGYNQSVPYGPPFLVFADLDQDRCLLELKNKWLKNQPMHPRLFFRFAIHEVESWILADRKNIAEFIGCASTKIPKDPDELEDPKQILINLAKKSRKKDIRGIVPIDPTSAIGPEYNFQLERFVEAFWDIENAIQHSPSLKRTVERFCEWKPD